MKCFLSNFKWENDTFWWEMLRLDEIGLSAKLNFIVPDKLFHFLMCFFTTYALFRIGLNRHLATIISYVIFMVAWEVIWDGCFRYGASWKDMIANTLGCLVCWWWLASFNNIGQME